MVEEERRIDEVMAGAAELKKEVQRVMQTLFLEEEDEEDNDNFESTADYALQILSSLKNLKLKQLQLQLQQPRDLIDNCDGIPVEFRCPISGLVFTEPVVLATGQTYDQSSIQKWLKDGNQTCPRTDQVLPHTILIPNLSIKRLIQKWYCKFHSADLPWFVMGADEGSAAKTMHSGCLVELLGRISSSLLSADSKRAVKELRMLTIKMSSFKALFADVSHSVAQISKPDLLEKIYSDADMKEDFVAMILNISSHDTNVTKLVAENPSLMALVIQSLKDERVETKSHAAAALCAMSFLDVGKREMGKSGAIKPLIHLMDEGNPLVLKDAALALHNLCAVVENREKLVAEGAVVVIMNKIIDLILIDEMLEFLATLCTHHEAIDQMEEHGGVFLLFNILKENTSAHNKEICVSILYTMCFNDRRKLRGLREVENAYETLGDVARNGTSRAKRKANGILERMNRFAFVSYTT